MFCEEGTPMVIISRFTQIAEQLSCPIITSACVSQELCPMPAPMFCKTGQQMVTISGFYKISDKLSCPRFEAACVEESLCAQN